LVDVAGNPARVAWACFPKDGMSATALLDSAWVKLGKVDARIEPILENASMVRLVGMMQELRKAPGPLLVFGEEGQGRAWLLSHAFEGTPYVEYEAMELLEEEPGAAAFVVRSFDKLPAERRQFLLNKAKEDKLRLGATASGHFEEARHFPWAFRIPPLLQRPEDIWPLAQAVVASVKRKTNRPRLFLGEPVRERLERYVFPKGVRELKNWVVQAAVASLRDEVGKEALPAVLTVDDAPGTDEEQMAAAEYQILLESLVRVRWNVSAAAKRLGIPRRTLIFRMAKLGFRRPQN
jgi:transcriptional regulator of acetoin/glycerol metabolism